MEKSRIFLYCDRAMEACLCFCIFFLPLLKAGAEVFAWAAFFFWLLKRALGYRAGSLWGILPPTELNKALGIFILVNALSVFFSVNLGLSLRGFFGKEIKFLAIFFMVVEVINTKGRLRNVFIAIFASMALVITDAAIQFFTGADYIGHYQMFSQRLSASFSNQNGFAAWLVMLIPVFLSLLLLPKKKLSGWFMNAALVLLVVVLSACLLRTYSRGAWLGALAGFTFGFAYFIRILSIRKKVVLLLVFAVFSAIFFFSVKNINFRLDEKLSDRVKSTGSVTVRKNLWSGALSVIGEYPATGSGLNTYAKVAGSYSHNSYLQMMAETGLLGLTSFFGVVFIFFKTGLGHCARRKDFLVLGFLTGIFAFLVHAFFDNHLYALQLAVLFWFMLGFTIAAIKLNADVK